MGLSLPADDGGGAVRGALGGRQLEVQPGSEPTVTTRAAASRAAATAPSLNALTTTAPCRGTIAAPARKEVSTASRSR